MKLYKPGTKVKIGEHYSVSATVSAVSIALEMKVLYEVFWWEGAERKEM